jgi:hypothetical protein
MASTLTDLALDHRWSQGPFGGVVGGFQARVFKEGPERLFLVQQLLGVAHRFGPRRSFSPPVPQIHHPLQGLLKSQPDRLAAAPQGGPVDGAGLVLVPVLKQLPLPLEELRADFRAGALPFGDGNGITLQVGPAQLALFQRELVAGREAIAHHPAAKGLSQKLDRRCGRTAQALQKHPPHWRHHDPKPTAPVSSTEATGCWLACL